MLIQVDVVREGSCKEHALNGCQCPAILCPSLSSQWRISEQTQAELKSEALTTILERFASTKLFRFVCVMSGRIIHQDLLYL